MNKTSEIIALKSKPELVKMVYDLLDENRRLKIKPIIQPKEFKNNKIKIVYLYPDTVIQSVDEIFKVVGDTLQLTKSQILSKRRYNTYCTARALISYKLHSQGMGLSEIGRLLNRDHSTIINSLTKYEQIKNQYEGVI